MDNGNKEFTLPEFKDRFDAMINAVEEARKEEGTFFALPKSPSVNHPTPYLLQTVGVQLLEVVKENKTDLPDPEDPFNEVMSIWIDTYNTAVMHKVEGGSGMTIGFLCIEADRYVSTKGVWHSYDTFIKFLGL